MLNIFKKIKKRSNNVLNLEHNIQEETIQENLSETIQENISEENIPKFIQENITEPILEENVENVFKKELDRHLLVRNTKTESYYLLDSDFLYKYSHRWRLSTVTRSLRKPNHF